MEYRALKEVFGGKRVLELLVLLEQSGRLRFSEIEEKINTSSDVITRSLRILEEYGLINRNEENPRNVAYEITEKGNRLLNRAEELEQFLETDGEAELD